MPTDLTPEGVEKLIHRLDLDLGEVERSTTPDALKDEIRDKIAKLKDLLAAAKRGLPSSLPPLAPEFAALAPLLKRALSLTSTDLGACRHSGTCWVTTRTQCKELSGTYSAGKDCANNPI